MAGLSYDPRLLTLLQSLRDLPASLSDHPNIYPFANFVLDPGEIEFYGTPQGALSHHLELVFRPRHEDRPIQLKGRGSSLEAVVEVLHRHLTGEAGENVLLWKWVDDLTQAALEYSRNPKLEPEDGIERKRRAPVGGLQKTAQRRKKKVSREHADAAKARTAVKYPHDPADLQDDPIEVYIIGHPRDELLDKLTIPCHSIIDPTHHRFRCQGAGCGWSCAEPRTTSRILKHARVCLKLDASLRQEVIQRGASLSLAARLRESASFASQDPDAMDDLEAQKLKTEKVNHALLKLLCDRMLPPSIVNSTKWHEFVHALDENITTASGNTISNNFVTTEAAYIRNESIKTLSNLSNLTLTFDGGTTRGGESIYTVHVTDPTTREAYLIEGNEASGVSHTGEHIEAILDRIITEIGPRRFVCVVSDNAGNMRAARTLLGQKYPWLVTLLDACHQQNNTAKDIGHLPYFRACISQLKSIITFFHSSSYARRHLAALCALSNIHGGLESDGRTRFVTIYYAARSVLRCITQILELFSSGVLEPKSGSSVYWLLDLPTVQKFTTELRQLVVVLEPLARSIKCLESGHSTPADVYHFWLAVLARYNELFKGNTTLLGSALPSSVIDDIRSIINGRYSEMFHGLAQQIYATAFFLDFRFRGADIFRSYPRNQLLPPSKSVSTLSQAYPADNDLRQAIPAYTKAGDYLLRLLAHVYNANPTLPLFTRYNNIWKDIESNLREQLMRFTRCLSPFHRSSEATSSREYWEEMSAMPGADLLSHLGVLINSFVPNSMAEERTMSAITKMNSPDRASQKVSTLFDMALIRQYYKREENTTLKKHRPRPTVRFADLSKHLDTRIVVANPHTSGSNIEDPSDSTAQDLLYRDIDELELEDEAVDCVEPRSRDVFEAEATDGIFLASKLLTDMLTDSSHSISASRSSPPVIVTPMQPQMHQPVDVSKLVY